ncbi:hypothetical protein [Streptomyces sp. NPDC002788]
MLTEALMAVAGAGGTAVVQAAGTDAWTGLRQRVARLVGCGDTQRERAELERLDCTAQALEEADATGETERTRLRQEASWQTRFESLLENLEDSEQQQVATELQALVAEQREFAARQGVVGNTFKVTSRLPSPVGVSSSPVTGACSSREARTGQLRSLTCSLPESHPHGS